MKKKKSYLKTGVYKPEEKESISIRRTQWFLSKTDQVDEQISDPGGNPKEQASAGHLACEGPWHAQVGNR